MKQKLYKNESKIEIFQAYLNNNIKLMVTKYETPRKNLEKIFDLTAKRIIGYHRNIMGKTDTANPKDTTTLCDMTDELKLYWIDISNQYGLYINKHDDFNRIKRKKELCVKLKLRLARAKTAIREIEPKLIERSKELEELRNNYENEHNDSSWL